MTKTAGGPGHIDFAKEFETAINGTSKDDFIKRIEADGVLDELRRLKLTKAITSQDLWDFYSLWALPLRSAARQPTSRLLWGTGARKTAKQLRRAVSVLRRSRELFPYPPPWDEYQSVADATRPEAIERMRERNQPVVVIGDLGEALLRWADFLGKQASEKRKLLPPETWFLSEWARLAFEKTGGKNVLDSIGILLFAIVFDCRPPEFDAYQRARERAGISLESLKPKLPTSF